MKPTRFETALALIDKANSEDINSYEVAGLNYPKELLYSLRMTRKLLRFEPNASKALQIAARAQHICRWKIARDAYPMDRVGYLKWREELKPLPNAKDLMERCKMLRETDQKKEIEMEKRRLIQLYMDQPYGTLKKQRM